MKKTKIKPHDEIKSLLPKLPHKMQVSFALYCAKDVFHLVKEEDRATVKACIDTVELWLKGKATVKECEAAAYAAANAINNVAYNASAAYYSAYYSAYYTAYAAADATYAAAHIAHYAAYAANAKAGGNGTTFYNKAMEKYLNHLNEMIKDLTSIERILFNIGVNK